MSPKKRGRKLAKRPPIGNQFPDAPLTDYELQRLRTCYLNNVKMRQLGLPVLSQILANTRIIPEIEEQKEKEDSDPEYNGEDEPISDGHLSDNDLELEELGCTLASLSYNKKKTTSKVTKRGVRKEQPKMQPGVLTRSQKNRPANVTAVTNQAEICNQAPEQGEQNGCLTGDENIQPEQNQVEHTTNGVMTDVNENGQTEGANVSEDDLFDQEWMRGPIIGRELVQMTRSKKGKLPLVIEPGKKRLNSVMIAAKFATECNIAVRNTVPIFPNWKDYKKHPNLIMAYIKRVGTKFNTDVQAAPVKKTCVAMMKKAIRQQRYKLKKRYFDALPLHQVPKTSPVTSMTDEQWDKLVDHWKNEKKMVTCEKNRENRGYEMQLKYSSIRPLVLAAMKCIL